MAITGKAMSYAHILTDLVYDTEKLKEAKKALAFCQFHDILPGSSTKAAEEGTIPILVFTPLHTRSRASGNWNFYCKTKIIPTTKEE